MKKPNAKAKRQQVKKAQKGHGIWSTPRINRVPSNPSDRDGAGTDILADKVGVKSESP